MSSSKLKLFRVLRTLKPCWTVVTAESERDAQRIASHLDHDAFQELPDHEAIAISTEQDIPEGWDDAHPYRDPAVSDYDARVCTEYFRPADLPLDDQTQFAVDSLLNGSIILRKPSSPDEWTLFRQFGVHQTSDGVLFSTLKPFPPELRPFAICYAFRPEMEFPKPDAS